MEKLAYAFIYLLIFIGFISCSSLGSKVKGSWILVEEKGQPVDRKQIKYYTGKEFIWHIMNGDDMIVVAGAGKYKINGDSLFEDIQMNTPNSSHLKGSVAKIKIKIDKDTLYQNSEIQFLKVDQKFTEKWVRMSRRQQ